MAITASDCQYSDLFTSPFSSPGASIPKAVYTALTIVFMISARSFS